MAVSTQLGFVRTIMPTYSVHAININSFVLGESDKVLTIFSAERGLIKAVAKGARKPGSKIGGRADVLSANKLLLSTGKTFEIIAQAESIESYPEFRSDLTRMSYALYYAELTQYFGIGLSEESAHYFEYLLKALSLQARCRIDPSWLCLEFEMGLLEILGYQPELTYCVSCRDVLGDYNLGKFSAEQGGICCQTCLQTGRDGSGVKEGIANHSQGASGKAAHITPLVWKNLVLATQRRVSGEEAADSSVVKVPLEQSIHAARRLTKSYLEHLAGRAFKALDLLAQLDPR
jgi:DNA repair protein RecO (recombination protein O)